MKAGRLDRKASFYTKVTSRDTYGATVETWPTLTFDMWGEVTYVSGDLIVSNEEKFYSGTIFLKVHYRSAIVETMRVKIADVWYRIVYMQELGRREGLQITLQKINE